MEGDESAEKDVERWDKTIKMNPEYQKEMEEKSLKWAEDQRPANEACVRRMRQLIPPDVRSSEKSKIIAEGIPETIAGRIWKTKALWLICMHPDDVKRIHIVDLKTKYNPQGLDIIELRALFQSLPTEFELDGDGKKAEWRTNIRMKLEELVNKEANKRLMKNEMRNPAYKGHDDVKIYDPEIVIERQQVAKSDPYALQEKASDIVANSSSGVMKAMRNKKAEAKPPLCEGLVHVESKEHKKLYLSLQSTNKDKGRTLFGFTSEEDAKAYTTASNSEEEADLLAAPKPLLEIVILVSFHYTLLHSTIPYHTILFYCMLKYCIFQYGITIYFLILFAVTFITIYTYIYIYIYIYRKLLVFGLTPKGPNLSFLILLLLMVLLVVVVVV
jgi:hypothetical protein